MKPNTAPKQLNTVANSVDNHRVEAMEKEIETLKQLLIASMNNKQPEAFPKDKNDIRMDEYVEVMSLLPYPLTLTTQPKGGGKAYKFNKLGEKKRILYNDLVDIIEIQQRFLNAGMFYILDERVISRHGLHDLYDNILDKEKLERVIQCDGQDVITFFKSATKKQQEILGDILTQKIVDGEYLDLNIISQIEKVGKISIIRRAEEVREHQAILEAKE